MHEDETPKKWYQYSTNIILLIIFFFPIGLYLMWKYADWSKKAKWIISGVFALLVLAVAFTPPAPETKTAADHTAKIATSTPTTKPTAKPTATPSPTPKPTFNFEVTNQIVKKVDGKYRYFFDLRNKDAKSFKGSVTVTLYTPSLKVGEDTWNTTQDIQPGLGQSVYIDIHTGPPGVYEDSEAASKFKYSVKQNGVEVKSGEGAITTQYEDLSQYGM